jgi:hypothetical protein
VVRIVQDQPLIGLGGKAYRGGLRVVPGRHSEAWIDDRPGVQHKILSNLLAFGRFWSLLGRFLALERLQNLM